MPSSARAMAEAGCVYLSFLGGGARPDRRGPARHGRRMAGNDLSHYRLMRIRVERLGPLTVAIDAHGNSLYEQLATSAHERRAAILAKL